MLSIETPTLARNSARSMPEQRCVAAPEVPREQVYRLDFSGSMSLAHCLQFEKQIIDALRDYRCVELDLSAVSDIDLYGIHLLGLLHRVAQREIIIVAASPAVASVTRRLVAVPPVSVVES